MRSRIVYHPFDPSRNTYFLEEKEVTEAVYRAAGTDKSREALSARRGPDGHRPACWPMVSDAMLVSTERQRKAVHENARARGLNLQFDRLGRPILESQGHRRQVCELMGMTDRNAGYGDRVGEHVQEGV
jgi:hypothetical protein